MAAIGMLETAREKSFSASVRLSCPLHLLRPPPYLPTPIRVLPLPHLRRLYFLRPPPYLPTQSAFIRVIRLIRDSDSYHQPRYQFKIRGGILGFGFCW